MLLSSLLHFNFLITGCAQQTFAVPKQTGSSSTKTITHHFFVSGVGRRKLSMQPKFVAAQRKMLVKQKPNIRKWIYRFY